MQLVARLEGLVDRVTGRWPREVLDPAGSPPVLAEEPAAILRAFTGFTLVIVTLQTLLHLVDAAVFDLRINRLDADREQTIWSWAGSASQLTAALGAALLLMLVLQRRRTLGFLAAVFAFFSLDETAQIHERLSSLSVFRAAGISGRVAWPSLYAPLMLITSVLLWRVSGAMDERCRRRARIGLVLLGLAVVLEFAVSTPLVQGGYGRVDDETRVGSMLYEYEVAAEEACELGGWLLIGSSLVVTAVDLLIRRARLRFGPQMRATGPTEPHPGEAA